MSIGMANLGEASCAESPAPPPSLMNLCEIMLASNLSHDVLFWKQVEVLPLHIVLRIMQCLSPLTLQWITQRFHPPALQWSEEELSKLDEILSSSGEGVSNRNECRSLEESRNVDYKTKRGKKRSLKKLEEHSLDQGISAAWRLLCMKRWPPGVRPNSHYELHNPHRFAIIHGRADWQQLYWEAHLQDCLNAAAGEASVSDIAHHISDFILPNDLAHQVCSEGIGHELCTLKETCRQFARYARHLRLQSVLCSEELVLLLHHARLHSIAFYNVRIRTDLTGICQLLTQSMSTLQRVEFYHSKFSGATLNKIAKAMDPNTGGPHRLQHFALISSRIFEQTELFSSKTPDFLYFLCGAKYLRTVKLCDNSLEQENVATIVKLIFQFSKELAFLHLVDNELGEVFTRLLASSLVSDETSLQNAKLVLPPIQVLDLRNQGPAAEVSYFSGLRVGQWLVCRLLSGSMKAMASMAACHCMYDERDGLRLFKQQSQVSNLLDCTSIQSLVSYLKHTPTLQQLNLSDNPLEDSGIRGLTPYLLASSSLAEVSLATCRMTAVGAKSLLESLSSNPVRSLSIASNHLGSAVAGCLAKFLRRCPVESLDISDIGLGPKGCSEELQEAMISNGRLLQLNISKNRIGAPGASMLASIIADGGSGLTNIDASANSLSVNCITSLDTALRSKIYKGTITSLDLRRNPGSFLSKLAGTFNGIGSLKVLLSDSPYDSQPVPHDDDP